MELMKRIRKIRSGGQTGVDRAALDAARQCGLKICGWCPKGGWAEDCPEPPGLLALYPELRETPSENVSQRTVWNVRDADATLIICPEEPAVNTLTCAGGSCGGTASSRSGQAERAAPPGTDSPGTDSQGTAPPGTDGPAGQTISPGTGLTEQTAIELKQPYLKVSGKQDAERIAVWLRELDRNPKPDDSLHQDGSAGSENDQGAAGGLDLNIAGPRASEWDTGYEATCEIILFLFGE